MGVAAEAATYQIWKPLDAATEAALRTSIVRWGVLVPVVTDQHGNVIDGHHRARIADELGVSYAIDTREVADENEARELALTLNADRRQLSQRQRREMVQALRQEGHTLRAIGEALGVSYPTVWRDANGDLVSPETTSATGQRYHDADRAAMFAIAMETDERGVGLHPMLVIGEKFGCHAKTVRQQLRRHPHVAQLPQRRYRSDGRTLACIGSNDPAPITAGNGAKYHVKRRHVDADRVVEATVSTLVGLAAGLALISDDMVSSLDAEKRLAWIETLREPLRAINHLREALR